MADTDIRLDEKTKQKHQEPAKWKVIVVNDDFTPVEFVVSLLMETFKHTPETAKDLTLEVHTTGSGVAGVYDFEIAEAKTVEATQLARATGFPLVIKMEEVQS